MRSPPLATRPLIAAMTVLALGCKETEPSGLPPAPTVATALATPPSSPSPSPSPTPTPSPSTAPPAALCPSADCDASAPPPRDVNLGDRFVLHRHQSVTCSVAGLTLTVDAVDYSPMHRVNGIEVFPYSVFHMTAVCHGTPTTLDFGQSNMAHPVCGHELRIVTLAGQDEATFVLTRPDAGP